MNTAVTLPAVVGRDICKTFRRATGEVVHALDGVSLDARHGSLTALVGPDGAGKTTLIRLMAGLIAPDSGTLDVLDLDVVAQPQAVQDRIGYMPQKFGLYEDLSVAENLDLYADLHGVSAAEREQQYPRLLEMTALAPFTKRLAGRLSGGMKQKLGLACTLVRSPELILLDEPTVGVDPLSRRELWEIILHLVEDEGLTVVLSTSYLDEAERCGHVVVLHSGRVLAQGTPAAVTGTARERTFVADPPAGQTARGFQARLLEQSDVVDAVPEAGRVRVVRASGSRGHRGRDLLAGAKVEPVPPRFEDAFMVLLRQAVEDQPTARLELGEPPEPRRAEVVVEVRDLLRRFGTFTAVDHVTFDVRRGEIFGLLGPNGAGKTTTFRMLCGLLAASGGTLRVAGADLRHARASARQNIGYVAQKFSLYGQLSVTENLEFFASAYGLRAARKRDRIDWAMQQFELRPVARLAAGQLPGGYKQRLAMAAALLHEPQILFLDEPTSGADPLARREFWQRITMLAEGGVTVIVTTHFMEEAEYCDRVAILDAGRILAQGAPAQIRARGKAEAGRQPDMEDAFIAIVQEARAEHAKGAA
jgi:ABC-2 type transport system ATP-binding protein